VSTITLPTDIGFDAFWMIAVIIHPEHSKNPINKDTHNTSLITTSFENIFQNFPPGIFGKIKSRSLCITSPALFVTFQHSHPEW
jgi:hypothetical protein